MIFRMLKSGKQEGFEKGEKMPISSIGAALGVICILAGVVVTSATNSPIPALGASAIGIYLMFAIRVADQWEKVAVLRLGRYVGLRGPGLFHIIPIVDSLSRFVDQRVRVASVTAESALTRDTVPVNVDAIVFWVVWNAEKSILEVEDFIGAITLSAQTALRESIGRHQQSVEIRDVRIPHELEDAMSRQAQAERERQARIILGQAETEIADNFSKAALPIRTTRWRCTCAR